jgi:peptidoglycan/xylan/chitin deacetylase (PgdA/CDA1 family)
MKLIKIFIALALLFTFSCQSLWQKDETREVAQYKYEDDTEAHARTFQSLMSAPTDAERSRNFAKYLDRQRNFYYIAQQLLFQFDERLDVIYNKKQMNEPLTTEDVDSFTKIRFQNLIAWEFSERNLHEMLDLYYLALKNANDSKSPYQKSCQWIVANVKKWTDEAWKKDDKSAIINLANHLNDVNVQLGSEQTGVKAPSFAAYLNPSQEVLKQAYARTKWIVERRTKTHFDALLENKWNQYLQERSAESEQEFLSTNNSFRTPQALDVLEPSADGKGHVTGNRFPMGKWAITFDDGPAPTHTQGMVNNLKNNGVHGTFFWQTQNILKYPNFPGQKSSLYSRASHSYTHANLPKQSAASLDKEVNKAVSDFAKVVGEKPTMYRCPYGACGPNGGTIRTMIAKQNMLHIAWNVDTLDWQDKNPESIFQRSKKQIDSLGRGIVLFHDIHPQSVIASDKVIKYLKTKYKVEALNKLIEESRGKAYYSP